MDYGDNGNHLGHHWGQMGYTTGKYYIFGVGMYVSASIQVSMFYDVLPSYGAIKPVFTETQYYTGLALVFSLEGGLLSIIVIVGPCGLWTEGSLFCDWHTWRCGSSPRNCWNNWYRSRSRYRDAVFTVANWYRSAFFYVLCFIRGARTFFNPMAV